MLRDHAERRLDKLLEQFEHLRPVGAVDRAVIEAAGDAHHGRDAQRIIDDIRPLLARTDREDHPLRRVDHRIELLDAEHTHVRDAGGAALIFLRLELVLLGAAGKLLHLGGDGRHALRSEEHTSELQSLMRISYAVFCLKKKKKKTTDTRKIKHKHITTKKTKNKNKRIKN